MVWNVAIPNVKTVETVDSIKLARKLNQVFPCVVQCTLSVYDASGRDVSRQDG